MSVPTCGPWCDQLTFLRPSPIQFTPGSSRWRDVKELLAFYYPGRQEPCDTLCHCDFLGNFYQTPVSIERYQFTNAEAAFQALKFLTKPGARRYVRFLTA